MAISSTNNQTTKVPALSNPYGSSGYKFIESVEKFTLTDLDKIESIALESEKTDLTRSESDPLTGTGRCATAIASVCFSIIEQVGLILRNDLSSVTIEAALKNTNNENAKSFFAFFSPRGLSLVNSAELDTVYYLFRNKVTHNLFPKYSLGISLDSSNPTDQLVIPVAGSFSLNVNFLLSYVKQAIHILKVTLGDVTNESSLIIMVENNAQLIDTKESSALHGRYSSNVQMQPYFRQWLPGITF